MASVATTATSETGSTDQAPGTSTRPNPVALEVLVSVTGARADGGTTRQLFTEDTKTVLVFRDGAVIRLSTPVAAGQLLFLTDRRTSAEVVCQVLHTRAYNETTSYVNLKFTEEKPTFWDVGFPSGARAGAEFSVKEHAEAEAMTHGVPVTPIEPHKAEDVEQLRKEVEALRKQLAEIQSPSPWVEARVEGHAADALWTPVVNAPASTGLAQPSPKPELHDIQSPAPTVGARVEEHSADAPATPVVNAPASTGLAQASPKPELHDIQSPAPTVEARVEEHSTDAPATPVVNAPAPEGPLMPEARDTEKQEASRPVVGMSLPIRVKPATETKTQTPDPSEALLPTPSLDFSQMPKSSPYAPTGYGLLRRPSTWTPERLLALGAFLVVALVLSLWLGKPWRYLGFAKVTAHAAAPVSTVAPVAAATGGAPEAEAIPANVEKTALKRHDTKNAAETRAVGADTDSPDEVTATTSAAGTQEGITPKRAAAKGKSRTAAVAGGEAGDNVTEAPIENVPVQPAKLIRAANPVYPPDAMLNFITGDVRAEALVEADGHVSEVQILSGPKPLREAAVEALKQYQYEPATQGGKAVACKVTVTVKFWFDP